MASSHQVLISWLNLSAFMGDCMIDTCIYYAMKSAFPIPFSLHNLTFQYPSSLPQLYLRCSLRRHVLEDFFSESLTYADVKVKWRIYPSPGRGFSACCWKGYVAAYNSKWCIVPGAKAVSKKHFFPRMFCPS